MPARPAMMRSIRSWRHAMATPRGWRTCAIRLFQDKSVIHEEPRRPLGTHAWHLFVDSPRIGAGMRAIGTTGSEIMATTEQMIEARTADQLARPHNTDRLKVAYTMSRFPKLTETFVLYEMLALQQQGVGVEIFPLINERANVIQEEAKPFVARARYQPMLSWPIIKAQWHFLR